MENRADRDTEIQFRIACHSGQGIVDGINAHVVATDQGQQNERKVVTARMYPPNLVSPLHGPVEELPWPRLDR